MRIDCDDTVHYPLGGASYIFKSSFIKYIASQITKKNIIISIGAQPNSSPHLGTLCVFSLAFSLADKLSKYNNDLNVKVLFEVVDTAPAEILEIDGVRYQKDLNISKVMSDVFPQYKEILKYFGEKYNISYEIRMQKEFNSLKEVTDVDLYILDHIDEIAKVLDPDKGKLRMRTSCPICGLTDKEGEKNVYVGHKITAYCPYHGEFIIDAELESYKLEYNTPLRNLIRAIAYAKLNASSSFDSEYIRITGNEYAGFYQEQLMYKVASGFEFDFSKLPIIVYCPMITDWSGAKLSKSLYVKKGAYKELPLFLQNYKGLSDKYGVKGLDVISKLTDEWLDDPKKLFRDYSIYYIQKRFEEYDHEIANI